LSRRVFVVVAVSVPDKPRDAEAWAWAHLLRHGMLPVALTKEPPSETRQTFDGGGNT